MSRCSLPDIQGNGVVAVYIVPQSGDGCSVLRMMAQLTPVGPPSTTGFFRMFGPRGHLGDSVTKLWTFEESYRVEVNQKAFEGSLWCAEFWMKTGTSFTRTSDPVCGQF
ncbi:hypothetical protein ACIA8G_33420 [Lentzea sp. NPDC051213]|uniref:hypothetical protein n=1 Tax=Lentzea sp. NPDC051213 TaxID=3364126 RepID=UPI003789F0A3